MVTDKRLLTEKELSTWLGLSLPTLQRMRSKGGGPKFIRLGFRRLAYRPSDVEDWLAARTADRIGDLASGVRAAMTAHVIPPANAALDQARRFLAKAVPWPENGEGYVNIHLVRNEAWRQKSRSGRGALAVRSTKRWAHSPGSARSPATRNLCLLELAADWRRRRPAETVTST